METAPVISAAAVNVHMDEAIVIDQAPPELKAWGPFRCPFAGRLPGGELFVTFTSGADHYRDQGFTTPFFVSRDAGRTWQRSEWPDPRMRGAIVPILDGEYYCFPTRIGLELDLDRLPQPVGHFDGYAGFSVYRLADCPEDVVRWFADLRALRWTPRTERWTEEPVRWDDRGQLIWSYNDTPQKISGDWTQKPHLESPVLQIGRELLYADYWAVYETAPDRPPAGFECSLMVSSDNARSWTRRSTLARLSQGDNTGEPMIALNQAGELVGVLRRDFGRAESMYLVHSKDQGYTWTPPQSLFEFGVLPRLLQLENGVLVLGFGRPGVWLSFSLDGGHSWTQPQAIVAGDPKQPMTHSCGYTSLLALGRDTFLLAYSDFLLPNAKGEPCKSILVRQISVEEAQA